MQRDELAAWLRLALTPRLGPQSARALLAAFGLPAAIFGQSREALAQVASPLQCDALLRVPEQLDSHLDATWRWLQEAPADVPRRLVTLADSAYPAALLQIEDPPLMLFALGRVDHGFPAAAIAVVGSRNPTPQGGVNARAFARSFAEAGLTVVSGLALGIDAAAHEGALEGAQAGQQATIAVIGTGLDRVYPKQNLKLAHRIAARGMIVSEYLLGTPPLEQNFPRRNRIIAGLGRGTLVVEAALKSGSLITARLASEQGKDVFAIPGSIHSPQSRGCHALIKEGAKLVETAADVLDELRVAHAAPVAAPPAAPDPLLDALGHDPVGLDALIARTGIPAPELQAKLLELELAGGVARLPGGLFQRVAAA
jgi:DNA processing protein